MSGGKFLIDGKFLGQRLTGVQRFAREILSELDLVCDGLDIELVLPESARANCPSLRKIKTVVRGKKASTLWEQTCFARYVRKQHGTAVCLCNSAPLFAKKIVCVHDMKPFAHPEYFSKTFCLWYRIMFRNIMKKAVRILTVSEFSGREIAKYFPKAEGRIEVVGNAWQHFARSAENAGALEKFALKEGEFFFALSSLEPNKNLKWIVETARHNSGELFAVAGGLNRKIFADEKMALPDNVRLLGYLEDADSKALMRSCKAFLFVTFYEGFGLPPLEALSAGAPCVIVSDTEVMHEVLGDNAVYVSPQKYDYSLSELLRPVGRECLGKYSWKSSAEKLLAVLKSDF